MPTPAVETAPSTQGTEASEAAVDTAAADDTAEQAVGIYNQIKQMALDFEKKTAGAKLARDKAKSVQG